MKFSKWLLALSLLVSPQLSAQDENEDAPAEEKSVKAQAADKSQEMASILNAWVKNQGEARTSLPRRWLFLQEQAGTYGSPSPLNVDKFAFDNYGWFQLAEAEAIRLFVQMNPGQKKDAVKPEEMPARLKRYAELARADAVLLKTSGENSSWAVYLHTRNMGVPLVSFVKGPESFRSDVPIAWLVAQLSYDAMVVGTDGDYVVLAKLKPLKRGAQGVVLKKSANALVTDSEKDVGALLRLVYDNDDYALAKVSLSKSGRPKIPVGSKVLFDSP